MGGTKRNSFLPVCTWYQTLVPCSATRAEQEQCRRAAIIRGVAAVAGAGIAATLTLRRRRCFHATPTHPEVNVEVGPAAGDGHEAVVLHARELPRAVPPSRPDVCDPVQLPHEGGRADEGLQLRAAELQGDDVPHGTPRAGVVEVVRPLAHVPVALLALVRDVDDVHGVAVAHRVRDVPHRETGARQLHAQPRAVTDEDGARQAVALHPRQREVVPAAQRPDVLLRGHHAQRLLLQPLAEAVSTLVKDGVHARLVLVPRVVDGRPLAGRPPRRFVRHSRQNCAAEAHAREPDGGARLL